MENGDEFLPIVVFHDGKDHWLASGFHRYNAVRMRGLDEIDADVRSGDIRDAILFAAGQNWEHGLRRTPDDKRRAVGWLLADEQWRGWSNAEIARRCRVTAAFVGKMRVEMYPVERNPASLNGLGIAPRQAQRGAQTYEITPRNQYSDRDPAEPVPARREAGIREVNVRPRHLQIRGTLESIDRAMSALPSPDQAVIADPDFALESAQRHARWWQAFAAHLQRRADRAS